MESNVQMLRRQRSINSFEQAITRFDINWDLETAAEVADAEPVEDGQFAAHDAAVDRAWDLASSNSTSNATQTTLVCDLMRYTRHPSAKQIESAQKKAYSESKPRSAWTGLGRIAEASMSLRTRMSGTATGAIRRSVLAGSMDIARREKVERTVQFQRTGVSIAAPTYGDHEDTQPTIISIETEDGKRNKQWRRNKSRMIRQQQDDTPLSMLSTPSMPSPKETQPRSPSQQLIKPNRSSMKRKLSLVRDDTSTEPLQDQSSPPSKKARHTGSKRASLGGLSDLLGGMKLHASLSRRH